MADRTADVIVIGAGLHGLSTAWHLAQRGVRVVVLEADYAGRHASGVNAGGVRTLGRHLAEIPLALASRALWHNLPELLGTDASFVASGQLKLAETDAELQECRDRVVHLQAHGFTHEVLIDWEEVFELLPTVAPHVVGGIWVADDGYATPYRVVTAVRQAAERLGVVLHEQTPALSIMQRSTRWQIETRQGRFEADQLVVTAGAWAGRLAAEVGEPVPTYPQGLMLMVTHRVAPFCKQVLGATGRALSFKQFDNGTVVIGGKLIGALDFDAGHGEVDIARLVTSAQTVTDLFPHLRHLGINRAWSGIEAFIEDDLPVISNSSRTSGLTYSFGYCGSGFQMSLGTGQRVAQLVLGESSPIDLAAFAIDRFHRDSPTPRPLKEPICNPLPVSKPTSA